MWECTYKAYRIHIPGRCGILQSTPLGARRLRRHTSGQRLALKPNCHIPTQAPPQPGLDSAVARYCPLWAPGQALTVLFLGTHTRTSQWVTHHGIALARTRLTLEFQWNPKPWAPKMPRAIWRWECTYKAYMIHISGRYGILQRGYRC